MPTDAMTLKHIDHVRMFVGNARQSAYFYRNAFGFEVIAYGGLETGMKHEACYVLRQGQITFVLASPQRPSPRSAPAGAARRRSPVHRAGSRRRSSCVRGGRGAGSASRVAPAHRRGRAWCLRSGRDPRLWRHNAYASEPVARSRSLRPGIPAARAGSVQPPHVSSSRPEGH